MNFSADPANLVCECSDIENLILIIGLNSTDKIETICFYYLNTGSAARKVESSSRVQILLPSLSH